MSNAARKARKQFRHDALALEAVMPELASLTPAPFQHVGRTGTPVPNRQENQPFIHTHGGNGKQVNTLSVRAKRRLREYDERTAAGTRGLPWPDHRRASRAA